MIVTDLRSCSLAATSQQLLSPAFGRGFKNCLRRQVEYDQYHYPMAAGGRVRFSRRRIGENTRLLVAEWPSRREVDAPAG